MNGETLSTVQLVEGDRVAVTHEGKTVKGRVGAVDGELGMVFVTFTKGEVGKPYNRSEVLPLYRYDASGTAAFPLCLFPVNPK